MPTTKVFVRPASAADADRIADIGARTFRAAFAAENTAEDIDLYLASAFGVHQIAREIADPASLFLLAYVGEEAMGYARLRGGEAPACVQGRRPVELVRLYLDQRLIGQGYGGALLRACLEHAAARGYETLWLGVWERNARALGFYQRSGFTAVGTHEFTLGRDVQTDLIMERPIREERRLSG